MKIKHTLKNETMKLSHFNENHILGRIKKAIGYMTPTNVALKSFQTKLVIDICLSSNLQAAHLLFHQTPDAIPEGEIPHIVSLCLYNTMVDAINPRDHVEVCTFFLLNTIFEEGSLNFRFLPSPLYSRLGPCRFV
jgi:DNA replicative helicase MCM subunit Mcm2 (Cdc46/Mcm family)